MKEKIQASSSLPLLIIAQDTRHRERGKNPVCDLSTRGCAVARARRNGLPDDANHYSQVQHVSCRAKLSRDGGL